MYINGTLLQKIFNGNPTSCLLWPSLPVISFFPILEIYYKLIRFLLHSSIVQSDKKIFLLRYGMSQADSAFTYI